MTYPVHPTDVSRLIPNDRPLAALLYDRPEVASAQTDTRGKRSAASIQLQLQTASGATRVLRNQLLNGDPDAGIGQSLRHAKM